MWIYKNKIITYINYHLTQNVIYLSQNEEERQQQLRDRAKKLIAEARKSINVSTSSTSIKGLNNGSARSSVSPVSDRSQTSLFNLDKVHFNYNLQLL